MYVLEFQSGEALARAFGAVIEADWAESCSAESERCRLRFLAPSGRAEPLVQRLYLHGGLTWCSRHDVLRVGEPGGAPVRA